MTTQDDHGRGTVTRGHGHPTHGLKELKEVQISVKDGPDVPQVACRQMKAQYNVLGHGHMRERGLKLDLLAEVAQRVISTL